jgi:hypothetical protein
MNSSAHTVVNGVTVFDPMMLKEPDSSVGDAGAGVGAGAGAGVAQPAAVEANPTIIIRLNGNHHVFILLIFEIND